MLPVISELDSRLKGYFKRLTHPTQALERTYCYNCGRPKGWVTQESAEFIRVHQILVICDACETKLGGLPLAVADISEV